MATDRNSKEFIVVIDQEKIEPDLARETVINYDPLNRSGKEGGFYLTEEGELHIEDEDVMEAHKMAINKYPYDDAIKMIQLPFEEGDIVHQFSENSFRLYGLPAPEEGQVTGILGKNGIGKSLSLSILSGKIQPNLGSYQGKPEWDDILEEYRGTGLQNHFQDLEEGELESAFKPQQVEDLPKIYSGNVRELLEESEERRDIEDIAERLEIDKLLDRELEELSGGELQRVAIASTLMKDADLYMFDEPSSFLDVKQRLKMGREIRKLAEESAVMVVEHDLATLDLVADNIYIYYGEPGSYGMVSKALSTREGINNYLDGYLPADNIQIRGESLEFTRSKRSKVRLNDAVMEYPSMKKDFGEGEFELETSSGELHEEEIMAIFGENGLGKTVFARMLAGAVEPDEGDTPDISIGYKPQYLKAGERNVRAALSEHANVDSKKFETRIGEPLELEELYDRKLSSLSGGELQRVGIALCLSRDADLYLLDEPSAYLDVETRVSLGRILKRFARKTEKPLMVIDHDILLLDFISDTGTVFTGEPGVKGSSLEPDRLETAMNRFLSEIDLTFRTDPETGRPRANKPGSQKDREQRESGDYYGN